MTTLCHRISEIYRSHLAVINLSESRTWFHSILLKLHLIKIMFKQENTFEAIADSLDSSRVHLLTLIFFRYSVARAVGAKVLLIQHPSLWQEMFLYLSVQ